MPKQKGSGKTQAKKKTTLYNRTSKGNEGDVSKVSESDQNDEHTAFNM